MKLRKIRNLIKKLLIIQGGIRSFIEDVKVFNSFTPKDYSFMKENENI